MTASAVGSAAVVVPSARLIVPALGITQILAWGSSYYLLTVLAKPIAADTGWPLTWIVAGLSLGLLVAGVTSPMIGRKIHAYGGRSVLAASAALIALGQVILGLSPNLAVFIFGWAVLGLGMSAGLYDAAFSTLGRLYGQGARTHITTVTLFGGLASTACWPLSAYFLEHFGWRETCFIYAAIHLCFSLPLYLFALKRGPLPDWTGDVAVKSRDGSNRAVDRSRLIYLVLAVAIMIGSMITTVISVHVLTVLQSRGLTLAAAVTLAALIGPAQVVARFTEMLISRYHHPIWTKVASVSLVAVGIGLLWAGIPIIAVALILYGAGIGLESIARATLPLALFGAANYAPIMGRLAMPSLIAQAAAPSLGALLIQWFGVEGALGTIVVVALGNLALTLALLALTAPQWRQSRQ